MYGKKSDGGETENHQSKCICVRIENGKTRDDDRQYHTTVDKSMSKQTKILLGENRFQREHSLMKFMHIILRRFYIEIL